MTAKLKLVNSINLLASYVELCLPQQASIITTGFLALEIMLKISFKTSFWISSLFGGGVKFNGLSSKVFDTFMLKKLDGKAKYVGL